MASFTRSALTLLASLTDRDSVLVVVERGDELTIKSLRNAPQVHLLVADQLNTYDVLCADDVIFTRGALDEFLAGPARGKGAKAVATDVEADIETGVEADTARDIEADSDAAASNTEEADQ